MNETRGEGRGERDFTLFSKRSRSDQLRALLVVKKALQVIPSNSRYWKLIRKCLHFLSYNGTTSCTAAAACSYYYYE